MNKRLVLVALCVVILLAVTLPASAGRKNDSWVVHDTEGHTVSYLMKLRNGVVQHWFYFEASGDAYHQVLLPSTKFTMPEEDGWAAWTATPKWGVVFDVGTIYYYYRTPLDQPAVVAKVSKVLETDWVTIP